MRAPDSGKMIGIEERCGDDQIFRRGFSVGFLGSFCALNLGSLPLDVK